MSRYDEGLCRSCTIPVCDEEHPSCLYRIWCEDANRHKAALRTPEQNRAAYKRYYGKHREAEIARVAAYDAANIEKRRERQRRHYQRKIQRETQCTT